MPAKKKSTTRKPPRQVTNAQEASFVRGIDSPEVRAVANGLQEAIFGWNPGSIGSQLSQVDTLFINNRWYMLSNMRSVLSQSYVEHGLIQNLVNVPVDDGMRGGYEIKSGQLSPEQVEELLIYVDRHAINYSVIGQAMKWNRLFGGAGILILTAQKPDTPLDMASLEGEDSKLEFRAVDMWELFHDLQNTEGVNPTGQGFLPEVEYYNYYGIRVHRSRVLKLTGLQAPSFIRPRLRGWGFSVVESLVRAINQYLKSNDLSFEVLDEFKLDIFKIKNLNQTLMSADGTQKVQQRVSMANRQKNYQNAIVMDGEDGYEQKQLTFAGIADMMREFRVQIASDMRMPMTKLFGISSAGFNSGEDDIENYNAMVESEIRGKCKYEIISILELVCQKKFGFVPDDLQIEFRPLRMLSSEQQENVKTQKYTRLQGALATGAITLEEFRDSCNRDNLFPIQLEDSGLAEVEANKEAALQDQNDAALQDQNDAEDGDLKAEGESESETAKGKKRLAKEAPQPKDPKDQEDSQ